VSHVSPIRVAILGLGEHMQENLLPMLQVADGVQMVAMCCRTEEKAQRLEQRYNVRAYAGSWETCLDSIAADAIVVAGPPHLHVAVARYALLRGLHAFIEKPPAEHPSQLRELAAIEAATEARCTIFVDYNFRFGTVYRQTRAIVERYGPIQYAKLRFLTAKPRSSMWNMSLVRSYLYSVGVHPVEMALDLFGPPRCVTSGITLFANGRFALQVGLDFSRGARADLDLGNYWNKFETSTEFVTGAGILGVVKDHRDARFVGEGIANIRDESIGGKAHVEYSLPVARGGMDAAGYANAFHSFCHSVRHGTPSESPLKNSLPVLEVLERIAADCEDGVAKAGREKRGPSE